MRSSEYPAYTGSASRLREISTSGVNGPSQTRPTIEDAVEQRDRRRKHQQIGKKRNLEAAAVASRCGTPRTLAG